MPPVRAAHRAGFDDVTRAAMKRYASRKEPGASRSAPPASSWAICVPVSLRLKCSAESRPTAPVGPWLRGLGGGDQAVECGVKVVIDDLLVGVREIGRASCRERVL